VSDDEERAERFADRFRAVYLTFHRRDGPRRQLQGASRAVLEHLAMAGPLTTGEAAAHLNRAQSVISEIVSHLEGQGLLERESDPADRRRTLIWLTPAGHGALRQDREVLGRPGAIRPPPAKSSSVRRSATWPPCPPGRTTRASPDARTYRTVHHLRTRGAVAGGQQGASERGSTSMGAPAAKAV
jgi:DNA-binding MarR family transcriptional regulator